MFHFRIAQLLRLPPHPPRLSVLGRATSSLIETKKGISESSRAYCRDSQHSRYECSMATLIDSGGDDDMTVLRG